MAQRINEDIRFYLPADPYYYQVDNLPLEDLLNNDIKLQDQIDELNVETTTTLSRTGFTELQPYINAALPGTVSARAGSFIGRVQRTSAGGIGSAMVDGANNGITEIGEPPTILSLNDYNIDAKNKNTAGKSVGRTSVFNFLGGDIAIDAFNYEAFESAGADNTGANTNRTPPLGRIDLVGITTVNGAMDDPYLPGNPTGTGVNVGNGYPRLAVVKGAGITQMNNGIREVVVGEKYITLGTAQEDINAYGRNLDGTVVPNPTFGTLPSPDDIVNVCFANVDVKAALESFADRNANASFFLPLAYVYVPQSHVAGNPIPAANLKDIRPFFRTAELTLAERQSLANSVNPSYQNPVITAETLSTTFSTEVDRTPGYDSMQAQIAELSLAIQTIQTEQNVLLDDPWRFFNGIMGNNTTFNVTQAIKPEHQGKEIKSLKVYLTPQGSHGDLGATWLGVRTPTDFPYYIVSKRDGVGLGGSDFMLTSNQADVTARVDGSGQVFIKTAVAGANTVNFYWYISGYTYYGTTG
tara:strand:- start:2512 stop:4086 length:1575 start_codon:yes stop_codon:yes gene_type:complete